MISRKTRTRAAAAISSAALLSGLALAGAPAANAAPERSPQREVMMPFPLGGEHLIKFNPYTGCHHPSDGSPNQQALRADVWDKDQRGSTEASLTMDAFLPFNTVTLDWKNLATGETGTASAESQGNSGSAEVNNTGFGEIEVTVTFTRALLPSFGTGSVMPGAVSHSETFVLAREENACNA